MYQPLDNVLHDENCRALHLLEECTALESQLRDAVDVNDRMGAPMVRLDANKAARWIERKVHRLVEACPAFLAKLPCADLVAAPTLVGDDADEARSPDAESSLSRAGAMALVAEYLPDHVLPELCTALRSASTRQSRARVPLTVRPPSRVPRQQQHQLGRGPRGAKFQVALSRARARTGHGPAQP